MNIVAKEVIEKYSNTLLQIAFQRTFNKSDSEDIVQDVFIKLIKNSNKIKDEEHLKNWLIRVTINLCSDYNKSFWNKNTTVLDEKLSDFDNEEILIFKEINKLKPIYRDIIYLYYYQGYKIKEISIILKMKENTVSSNLTRAREKLKTILEEKYNFTSNQKINKINRF